MNPSLRQHQDWLGYVQPTGLVVSAPALVNAGCNLPLPADLLARQASLISMTPSGSIEDLDALFAALLDWQPGDLVPAQDDPSLEVALPDYHDALRPSYAVPKPDGEPGWQMLVVRVPGATDLDAVPDDATPGRPGLGWRASPQTRLERLLRDRDVAVGLLVNDHSLRLVYAPRAETSGHITFALHAMRTVAGRPILGALCMLLGAERLWIVPPNKRLPRVLADSRKYQNEVSTRLAEQVLGALDELVRGFELADADRGGALLRHAIAVDPQHVYGGLITVLLRLVFLLYAEERALMPGDGLYAGHYSVGGLFEKLRAEAGRHPDTMDQRYGAWARLVTLFRLVYEGGGDGRLHLPARHGALFDPERYPFLEGRPYRQIRSEAAPIDVPRVPDGVVWRVLEKLLMLRDGEAAERVSFRSLDVEQIGSVYEAMMGFELRRASAPSLALKPKRLVINLREGLASKDRNRWLSEAAETELSGKAAEALKSARSVEELAAALDKKAVDRRIIPEGGLYLEPGEERRRSGSHYTPRALTEPIVRTTLRPVLEALGERPTPAQILALKVCDPAMGSGAFLVEATRQLGDALVRAFDLHGWTLDGAPVPVPADETPTLCAMRLVAQRCIYGVDKNPFAVNLAKLSLWLVTLARDHAFTFLDHALKHGDSLVGLTRRQIGRFDWQPDDVTAPPLLAWIERQTANAVRHRQDVQRAADGDEGSQRVAWLEAEEAVEPARVAGDLCIAAFFAADKDKAREEKRQEHKELLRRWRDGEPAALVEVARLRDGMRTASRPLVPFHWELEFPEVFERGNPGFDCVVGNPPFAGKNTVAASSHSLFPDWLKYMHIGSHGNADIVAHFFRRAFGHLRKSGTLGCVATNTIAQGDTRATGLEWIRANEGWIYHVDRRFRWPGVSVVVSVVHISRASMVGSVQLDQRGATRISAFLFDGGPDKAPTSLIENVGCSFQGSVVLGVGFTFDDISKDASPIADMARLTETNPRNAMRIFPYIGGEELNDSPNQAHRRYVINFGDMTEDEAREWPDLMAIVEAKVKPARMAQNRESRAKYWWRFGETTPALNRALGLCDAVLATSLVTKHLSFSILPSKMVFSHKLAVFTVRPVLPSFLILQSRIHEVWARFFSSTSMDLLNYSPSDCFETFPFPENWTTSPPLEAAGQAYYEFRAALMIRNDEGLTKTYNRFHDPDETSADILELRRLHAAMDRAVLDAYGWNDVATDCEWRLDYEEPEDEEAEESGRKRKKKKPWRWRWPEPIHDEVLARLLALNQQRAEAERLAAAPPDKPRKPAAKAAPKAAPKSPRAPAPAPPSLFPPRRDGEEGS